ncbi:MAG TPA: SDR family oxidoreductase [Alphaproteobacteria bacterium]|jgi:NAD(P)-dependent dehydrogenase (short-subunit alcohol dehydrogenase family)|nr:SDR family oxidoreductase [Alphaproteobacteria bacterium]
MSIPAPLPIPRAALVTGAAKRIGRAIALGLADAGYAVAVHHLQSHAEAEALVAEIKARGGKAAALACDLSDETSTASLLIRATEAVGHIGVLVNSASVFERDEALTATRASWDRHMNANLRAPFVLTQALARELPAGSGGVVVNLVDERVWNLTPHFVSYTLSKAALWTMTQTMALALAPRVRVNAIGPGPVLPSPRQSEEQFAKQWSATPLKRPATPEEVASAVRFLLETPSITGQMIALDSGQHLGWTFPRLGPMEE